MGWLYTSLTRLYIFIGVGLSALLVLTFRAIQSLQDVEPGNMNRLHVLFLITINF